MAPQPDNARLGPAEAGQAGEFSSDVIGPPDYVFGPPPGAEAPGVDTPGADGPDFETAGFGTAGFEAAAFDSPTFEPPGLQVPGFEPPGLQTPAFEPPAFEPPGHQTPAFEAPGHQTPAFEAPGHQGPNGAGQDVPNPGAPPATGMPGTGMPGTGMPGTGMPGTGMPDTGATGNGLPAWRGDTWADRVAWGAPASVPEAHSAGAGTPAPVDAPGVLSGPPASNADGLAAGTPAPGTQDSTTGPAQPDSPGFTANPTASDGAGFSNGLTADPAAPDTPGFINGPGTLGSAPGFSNGFAPGSTAPGSTAPGSLAPGSARFAVGPTPPDTPGFNVGPQAAPDTAALNLGLPPGGPSPTLAFPHAGPVRNGHGQAAPAFPDADQTPGAMPPWPAPPPPDGPPHAGPAALQAGPFPPPAGPLPPQAWPSTPQAQPLPPPPGSMSPQLGALPPPPGTLPGQAGAFPPAAGLSGQAFPAQPPSAFPAQPPNATGGSDRAFPASGRRPRGKKALVITAAVAAAAVAAGAFIVLRPHPAAQHTAQPAHSPAPTAGHTGPAGAATPRPSLASKIDSVTTDPKPITRAEIFPAAHVTTSGRQFARVAAAVNRNCAASARGAFAAALMASNCERVIRVTYVDSAKRIVVTAGVAALPTKAAAERVNRAKRLKRNIWFAGLDGKAGSGAQMISATGGYAYGLVDGRYIVFAYATYTNGHTPTGKNALDQVVASVSRSFALLAQQPITARAAGS